MSFTNDRHIIRGINPSFQDIIYNVIEESIKSFSKAITNKLDADPSTATVSSAIKGLDINSVIRDITYQINREMRDTYSSFIEYGCIIGQRGYGKYGRKFHFPYFSCKENAAGRRDRWWPCGCCRNIERRRIRVDQQEALFQTRAECSIFQQLF